MLGSFALPDLGPPIHSSLRGRWGPTLCERATAHLILYRHCGPTVRIIFEPVLFRPTQNAFGFNFLACLLSSFWSRRGTTEFLALLSPIELSEVCTSDIISDRSRRIVMVARCCGMRGEKCGCGHGCRQVLTCLGHHHAPFKQCESPKTRRVVSDLPDTRHLRPFFSSRFHSNLYIRYIHY